MTVGRCLLLLGLAGLAMVVFTHAQAVSARKSSRMNLLKHLRSGSKQRPRLCARRRAVDLLTGVRRTPRAKLVAIGDPQLSCLARGARPTGDCCAAKKAPAFNRGY